MDQLLSAETLILLVRRWTWLAAGAAIAAAVGALYLLAQPRVYTATVDVVPKRARTQVNYDTPIRTLTDTASQNAQSGAALTAISSERRQALAQLVKNADVERVVEQELGDTLPRDLRAPGRLMQMVQGKVVPRSEIITIEVGAPTAPLAQQIASSWAHAYEQQVNTLYANSTDASVKLDGGLADANQKYSAAEQALTTFVATTPLADYSRLLNTKQQLLADLVATKQAQLSDLGKVARRVDLLIGQAQALQQQLAVAQDNSAATSNQLALTLLKTQAFASSMSLSSGGQISSGSAPTSAPAKSTSGSTTQDQRQGDQQFDQQQIDQQRIDQAAATRALPDWSLPAGLQLQLPATTAPATLSQQRADVAATLQALHDWSIRLQQEIDTRTRELAGAGDPGASAGSSGDGTVGFAALTADIRDLQGKIAEQKAQQKNLQQQRDVSWESYSSLQKKVEETRVANAIGSGNEVSLASQAVVAQPKPRRLSLVVPLAAMLGALAAAAWLIIQAYLVARYRDVVSGTNGRARPDIVAPLTREVVAG